jgi:tetratricopeptide (TPR) repeat protein
MSYTETPYAALMLDESEDYELVIAELTKHIETGAPPGAALHNRAIAKWEIGRCEEALNDFDQAILELPHSHLPAQMKGMMLQKLGRVEEALLSLDQAVAIAPKEVSPITTRAYARMEAGLLSEALEDFECAIKIKPSFQRTITERDKLVARIRQGSARSSEASCDV